MTGLGLLKKMISGVLVARSVRRQARNEALDLSLWDLHQNASGHISIGDVDTVDLIEQYGSPLFVVNHARLKKDVMHVLSAAQNTKVSIKSLYSYKTNCIPGILKKIHEYGLGAEVISPYELWLANKMGVQGHQVVFNGVHKTDDSIRQAIDMDVFSINIDDATEIDRISRIAKEMKKTANVGVRLGLIQTSQFGMDVPSGSALDACRRIAGMSPHLNLKCIHFNVTSNSKTAATHKHFADLALQFMHEFKSITGHHIPCLDIGGGFGVATTKNMTPLEYGTYRLTGCLPRPPRSAEYQSFDTTIKEISDAVFEACTKYNYSCPQIIIEPGRLVTSSSQMLLTKINSIKKKEDGTQFVITDTGRLSTSFPCDFEYHEMLLANRPMDKPCQLYQIMGRICTSADWLMKNRFLPVLDDKDLLAVMDAGAYFSSYSSNFAFQKPPIVMVSGNDISVLRNEESFEHLIAMDCM